MQFSKKLKTLALVGASAALLMSGTTVSAGSYGKKKSMATKHHSAPTIVGVAAGNKDFETLVAAVKAAGLVDTLNSKGPFTVFAPTDAAFEKLPEGTVGELVKPENKATLTSILTYHVIPGKVTAANVMALLKKHGGNASVTTVQGGKLKISKGADGSLFLTDAQGNKSKIIATDVKASNGVIHAIDSVVMP